jgi:hypothetical protein
MTASMALVFIVPASAQEKLVGTYGEDRTSLAFHTPDATAQNILPQGWLPSPFSAGAAKGANLVVTFMDWLVVQGPGASFVIGHALAVDGGYTAR